MQLTTARLKQIIKEELEAIVAEMGEETTETTTTELTPEEQEVAALEQQLAEAKKKAAAKSKTGGMKVMKGDANAHSSAKAGMKPMSGKRHDMKAKAKK